MSRRRWTAEEIRALGVRTDLETAASIWGIGRTRAYELARAGEFPCPVRRVGTKYVVLVTPMLRALGIEPPVASHPGGDQARTEPPLSLLERGRDHDARPGPGNAA